MSKPQWASGQPGSSWCGMSWNLTLYHTLAHFHTTLASSLLPAHAQGILPSQGFCTCYSLCLKCSFLRFSMARLSQIFDQMLPFQQTSLTPQNKITNSTNCTLYPLFLPWFSPEHLLFWHVKHFLVLLLPAFYKNANFSLTGTFKPVSQFPEWHSINMYWMNKKGLQFLQEVLWGTSPFFYPYPFALWASWPQASSTFTWVWLPVIYLTLSVAAR